MRAAADRLRERLSITDDGCWEYTGARVLGYGVIKDNGRQVKAHRLAYEIANGPLPAGVMVLHSCDNRACANPDHLRVGTHAENMADRKQRGRTALGARCGRARLTVASVQSIRARRAAGDSVATLAREHGVSERSIRLVVSRRSWGHIQ